MFVHDRSGAFGGAESNILATAGELQRRGHELGLLQGPSTRRDVEGWLGPFSRRFPCPAHGGVDDAIACFGPEAV
ncbi:MAG: hypothetical protein U1F98_12055 [Verrucomicrobiota bacterium]